MARGRSAAELLKLRRKYGLGEFSKKKGIRGRAKAKSSPKPKVKRKKRKSSGKLGL